MSTRRCTAVGVIPARWASTRLPGKPLADIGGKSLIQRTFERATASKRLDHVVVATDDARIVEACHAFGAPVILTALGCETGTDRVAHAVAGNEFLRNAELVVNIQGDEPFINPAHIDAAVIALAESDEQIVMSTLATRLLEMEEAENSNVVKVVCDVNDRALYFSRARIPHGHKSVLELQNVEGCLRHIGLYAFRRDFLERFVRMPRSSLERAEDLEQLRVLQAGFGIRVVEVESVMAGIDTPQDLEVARALVEKLKR